MRLSMHSPLPEATHAHSENSGPRKLAEMVHNVIHSLSMEVLVTELR